MKKRKRLSLRKETLAQLDRGLLNRINAGAGPGSGNTCGSCHQTCDGCDTKTCSVSFDFTHCHNCDGVVAQQVPKDLGP